MRKREFSGASKRRWGRGAAVWVVLAASGCLSTSRSQSGPQPARPLAGTGESAAVEPDGFVSTAPRHLIAERYRAHLEKRRDLSYPAFVREIGPKRRGSASLDFDPRDAKYYERVVKALSMTPEEEQLLRHNGFVSLDHGQRHTMGSVYFRGFVSDLPVLVTTDSILHAMHRSFDNLLVHVEDGICCSERRRRTGRRRSQTFTPARTKPRPRRWKPQWGMRSFWSSRSTIRAIRASMLGPRTRITSSPCPCRRG